MLPCERHTLVNDTGAIVMTFLKSARTTFFLVLIVISFFLFCLVSAVKQNAGIAVRVAAKTCENAEGLALSNWFCISFQNRRDVHGESRAVFVYASVSRCAQGRPHNTFIITKGCWTTRCSGCATGSWFLKRCFHEVFRNTAASNVEKH